MGPTTVKKTWLYKTIDHKSSRSSRRQGGTKHSVIRLHGGQEDDAVQNSCPFVRKHACFCFYGRSGCEKLGPGRFLAVRGLSFSGGPGGEAQAQPCLQRPRLLLLDRHHPVHAEDREGLGKAYHETRAQYKDRLRHTALATPKAFDQKAVQGGPVGSPAKSPPCTVSIRFPYGFHYGFHTVSVTVSIAKTQYF